MKKLKIYKPGIDRFLIEPIVRIESNASDKMLGAPFGIKTVMMGKIIAVGKGAPVPGAEYVIYPAHFDELTITEYKVYTIHKKNILGYCNENFKYYPGDCPYIEVDPILITAPKKIFNLQAKQNIQSVYVKIKSGKLIGQIGICHVQALISNNFYSHTLHLLNKKHIAAIVEVPKNYDIIPLEFYERRKEEWLPLANESPIG